MQYAAMQVFNYTMQHAGQAICSMHPCSLQTSSIVWTFPELLQLHRMGYWLQTPTQECSNSYYLEYKAASKRSESKLKAWSTERNRLEATLVARTTTQPKIATP